jgi:plasmid stabilization system protein ParE
MTYHIFRHPQAIRDLEECFVFIAEENFDAGSSLLVAVEESLEQIAKFPEIGKRKDFAGVKFRNVRMWPVTNFDNYLIFYNIDVSNKRIEFIRLLHSSRDILSLFEE